MHEHRALVVTIPTAALPRTNGANLRVGDVVAALEEAGHEVDVAQSPPAGGRWCTAVAVSYASAGHVRRLRELAPRTWLDAMDSWLLVNGSGVRAGHASYAVRAVRDGARLGAMPRVDLATYISAADRRSDHATVRAARRLVLPGRLRAPATGSATAPRAVLVGEWGYAPNRDGLRWLCREVLARTSSPVHLYGAGAPAGLPDQIRVHGYVEDETQIYRRGDVHLAPVRFGGGVKRKVLHPLLAGLAVISTRAGAHGLRRHPLLDVQDDPAAFARSLDRHLAAPAQPGLPPQAAELLDADERGAVLAWIAHCPGAQPRSASTSR